MRTDRFKIVVSVAVLAVICGLGVVWAQEAEKPAATTSPATEATTTSAPAGEATSGPAVEVPKDKKVGELWTDFLYYIRIARPELAKSWGQAILDSGATPRDIYLLSIASPNTQTVLNRGSGMAGMKEMIEKFRLLIEQGYEVERADPEQIKNAITMLGDTIRAYEIGARRLERSGEYALPQLIQKLGDAQSSSTLKERIINVLPRLGKDAVRGLCEALQSPDPQVQEAVANTLGKIEYAHAAPQLKALADRKDVLERTKKAALAALVACAGKEAVDKPAEALFLDVASKYYYQAESVAPDARYSTANVWNWKENLGLEYKPVPREIFCDIYAMRMARGALEQNKDFAPAIPLWLAANLKRQADLPAGAVDPTRTPDEPTPQYYIRAASARFQQDVLGRALKDRNSAVATGAIQALAVTSGAKNLVEATAGGAQPLVEALGYPDKQVRFLAAVSLANATPDKRFTGSQLVVPVLMDALRQSGRKIALVVVADAKQRNALKDAARSAGYEVAEAATMPQGLEAIKGGGMDVVIVGAAPTLGQVLDSLRSDAVYTSTPVVVAGDDDRLKIIAKKDGHVVLMAGEVKAEALAAALTEAQKLGAGKAMSAEESSAWAVRAGEAIRTLGLTGNTVYDIAAARPALIAAAQAGTPEVKISSARALAVMPAAQAQNAIVELAVKADTPEDVRIKAFEAGSESVRRFGSQISETNAQAILDVVTGKGTQPLLDAAAQLLGAMNLPGGKIHTLIIKAPGL